METFAAFVAVRARALSVRQQVWLGCAAVEAIIEAGLFAEANVGQAHAAGWAVVIGPTESIWRNRRQSGAAFQTLFDFRDQAGLALLIFDLARDSRGLGCFGVAGP